MKLKTALLLLAWSNLACPAFASEPGLDQWGVAENSDPMTDEKIVTAGVGTAEGFILKFQCWGDHYGVIIMPYLPMAKLEFITMDAQADVAWRIDKQPAVTERWQVMGGKAGDPYVVVTNSDQLTTAILAGGQKLTIRVHGLTGNVTLQDAAENVKIATTACGL